MWTISDKCWFDVSVNWFRKEYGRTDSTDSHDSSESPTESSFVKQPSLRRRSRHRGTSRTTRGYFFLF